MRTSEVQVPAILWIALVSFVPVSGACKPSPSVRTSAAPEAAIKVHVTSRRGIWTAAYPSLDKECERRLIIPTDQPFAVQVRGSYGAQRMCIEGLGVNQEISPEKDFSFWVHLEEPGRHEMGPGCPEGPDRLQGTVQVVEASDWEAWLRSGDCAPLDPEAPDYGERLFNRQGCSSCHSLDGQRGVGPSLDGILGRQEVLVDGSSVVIDEAYIRESIRRPSAKVVRGYAPIMPDPGDALDEAQVDALVHYLKGRPPSGSPADGP